MRMRVAAKNAESKARVSQFLSFSKNKFQTCALETALLVSLLSDYAAQLPTVLLVLHPVFG